jgi:phosphonopyruvate decarboxylase
MGLAGGFSLAGRLPVVLMQNDGYGNAVNPLSSLQLLYKLPCLLLISWRGGPGRKDAPQHTVMGKTIQNFLSIFEIGYEILESGNIPLQKAIDRAKQFMMSTLMPYALLIRKGYFEDYVIRREEVGSGLETRGTYLNCLKTSIKKADVIIGSTGFSGRELNSLFDHKGKFYMMGSMGCAASIGLALAKENPERKVFVIDGDGALLMKMGTLSTIGYHVPGNLLHICFDNNQYESTGGQKTASSNVNIDKVASACGYSSAKSINTVNDFKKIISTILDENGPHFIHVRIKPGTIESLPRPAETAEEMKQSLISFLTSN